MRKNLLIVSLAGLTVMAAASEAFGQRRGFSGGRGGAPNISGGVGRDAYSPFGYGNRPYGSDYRGYGNNLTPNFRYGEPNQFMEPAYGVPSTQLRPSYYPDATLTPQSATVAVFVPDANAQVWFENGLTKQTGKERMFHSPPLEPNRMFTYTVKARWMENGQTVDRESQVSVRAGQSHTVTFMNSTRESLPRLPDTPPRE